MAAFSFATAAGAALLDTIDRKSTLDPLSDAGKRLSEPIRGQVELRNVKFRYPARPEVPILHDFSLDVPAGATVALVGASGSGK